MALLALGASIIFVLVACDLAIFLFQIKRKRKVAATFSSAVPRVELWSYVVLVGLWALAISIPYIWPGTQLGLLLIKPLILAIVVACSLFAHVVVTAIIKIELKRRGRIA